MFRLESNILKREFKVVDGNFLASQIINTASGMQFIPDGNGSEFLIKFADGNELSSKGLPVINCGEKDGTLFFRFQEMYGTTVDIMFGVAKDGNTIKKQIVLTQSEPKVIDYIALENIGIINSTTSFSVPGGPSEIDEYYSNLGQPFYIDSLFVGCEFPATKNSIFHGRGQVRYYLGKSVIGKLVCPATVIGGATGNTIPELKSAFFKYIDSIALKSPFHTMYNTWYDRMLNIDADFVQKAFYHMENELSSRGIPPIDGYVMDDGWNNYNGDFWWHNTKKFPNGFIDASNTAKKLGSEFGLWLGPRGGYNYQKKFAKRIEKKGFGYFNAESQDICVGSEIYLKNLEKFFVETTEKNDISYWKIDGFCLKPCKDINHDHITGGENEMYFVTELWQRWIHIFEAIREVRTKQGKDMWLNITCYVNPSPWWLQYANSVWLQNSLDIGFAENYPAGEQSQMDAELTYRDSIYFDFLCKRALQFPVSNIYNHEPIYGNEAHQDYSDEEFEKMIFWNACRGQALNELYISSNMMNEAKWNHLARALSWQKANHYILKNAMFLGGDPKENNIYCYAAWTPEGEGVIALRNPTNESAGLTLTLNKLMGCPESLKDVKRFNIYNESGLETDDVYNYNDKINMSLNPFEIRIFQFGKKDKRISNIKKGNPFTISFECDNKDKVICKNDDVKVAVEDGFLTVSIEDINIKSTAPISAENHEITIVREVNKMIKLYIDKSLDCSGYDEDASDEISTDLTSLADKFSVIDEATPYNEIIKITNPLKSKRNIFKKED